METMREIKKGLQSSEENIQVLALKQITKHLKWYSNGTELFDGYLKQLITNDIVMDLCSILSYGKGELLNLTTTCVKSLCKSKIFFQKSLAPLAIGQILRNCFLLLHNPDTENYNLTTITYTLKNIFQSAKEHEIDVKTICELDQVLSFIAKYIELDSANLTKLIINAQLFNIILSDIKLAGDNDKLQIILKIHETILDSTTKLINNLEPSVSTKLMEVISSICNNGLKFGQYFEFVHLENTEDSEADKAEADSTVKENLLAPMNQKTRDIILDVIIPNAKKYELFESTAKVNVMKNLISCLNEMYKHSHVDVKKLSWALINQGYVIYLSQLINTLIVDTNLLCQCLSYILTDLASDCLAVDLWPDKTVGLRRYLNDGLIQFTGYKDLQFDSPELDTILFVIYFHYQATSDPDLVKVIYSLPLTRKILLYSTDNPPPVAILQIIWFFFCVYTVENSLEAAKGDKYLSQAAVNLIELIKTVGVENCYVCHPVIVIVALQHEGFPIDVRHTVVKLWLKTDSKLYNLVSPERIFVLVESLIYILFSETGDLLEKAAAELLQAIATEELAQSKISPLIWELFSDVIKCSENSEQNVRKFLEVVHNLNTSEVSIVTAVSCTVTILNLFTRETEKDDEELNILLLKLGSKMLSIALNLDDAQVGFMFIHDAKIIMKIYRQAYQNDSNELSSISFKCLSQILQIQRKHLTKSSESLVLNQMDLYNPLIKKPPVCYEAMGFVNEIWLQKIQSPAVKCSSYEKTEALRIFTGIYRKHIMILGWSPPYHWQMIFNCLINLLKFCRENYEYVLYDCCDYLGNHMAVRRTMSYNYSEIEFFDFVNVWLEQCLYSQSSFAENALRSKQLRKDNKPNELIFESPFDVALKELDVYIKQLISSGKIEQNLINHLITTLNTFI